MQAASKSSSSSSPSLTMDSGKLSASSVRFCLFAACISRSLCLESFIIFGSSLRTREFSRVTAVSILDAESTDNVDLIVSDWHAIACDLSMTLCSEPASELLQKR